jgi:hypothetical protein
MTETHDSKPSPLSKLNASHRMKPTLCDSLRVGPCSLRTWRAKISSEAHEFLTGNLPPFEQIWDSFHMMPRSLMLGQVAGCNRLHDLAGRLARWLLMIQDRTGNSLLKLTQEFLAEMIGSQRTTVSEVAGGLQDRGLIEYARGSIKIVDRIGLENASCECYPVTRKLLADVYKLANQTVFEDFAG